ncbi:MAG: hypothetical protein DHS80DRAFT_30457 [Piptocephalis tieghemiana]|nr:MAG: hypothetical protein DHS80DRAFT_30457 [Piptocephalis tieghemiana]
MLGFGLGQIFYILLLLINSLAILSEDRFLAPIGWAAHQEPAGYGEQGGVSVKGKLINLISAFR